MNKLLKKCKKDGKSMQCIREVLRTTDHYCSAGAIMLQFFFDTEIYFRNKHWNIFKVLLSMGKKFGGIEKLIFDTTGETLCTVELSEFFKLVPNLKIFKGVIYKEDECLGSLQKNCPKLVELSLFVKDGFFRSSTLTEFFFAGKSLSNVRKCYSKLDDNVKLSFPKLEFFSFNRIHPDQYDFFKMFFHYYTKVNVRVVLDDVYENHSFELINLSWFDAVLSHSVVLNPNTSVKQCDLNLRDLFLPFCEQNLKVWKNLNSLVIYFGNSSTSKRNLGISSCNILGKKLESLMKQRTNIKELCIRVVGPVLESDVTDMLVPTFKSFGGRLQQLKLMGDHCFFNHRCLMQLINFCSHLKRLVIAGRRISKYVKDVKLAKLDSLESLMITWSENATNPSFCPVISKISFDIIRQSPNIKHLSITANLNLMESLAKYKFAPRLQTLIIFFYTEKSLDGLDYLKRILPSLPNLKEIVVKENRLEKQCECVCSDDEDDECICDELVDSIYSALKRQVGHTQVFTRYYSLEDSVYVL